MTLSQVKNWPTQQYTAVILLSETVFQQQGAQRKEHVLTQPKQVILLESNGPANAGLSKMELDPTNFQSSLPTQHVHVYYNDPTIGLSVGVWDTTTMQEAFGPYPGDEFIWVLEGAFSMVDGFGKAVSAQKGDCVYFRNAIPISWHQDGYLKKFYVTYVDPSAEMPRIESADKGIGVLDPAVELVRMTATDPFDIDGVLPVQDNHTAFTNDTGNFHVGTWESGPMLSKMAPFPTHEFVCMLEGELVITHDDGTVKTFRGGDCFFVPKGTVCSWHIPAHVKKHYAILDL